MNDEGVYKVTCDKGHKSIVFTQQPKFQYLFDLGAMALLDGYPREAVSSFVAALERFYEFFIEVILTNKNIDEEQFKKAWKLVSNQSERQLGGFYFLYLSEFGKAPMPFDTNQIAFRNSVIHKGYIPKYDEVTKYASYVLQYIYEIGGNIRNKYNKDFTKILLKQQNHIDKTIYKEYRNIIAMYIPSIIEITVTDNSFGQKTFDKGLKYLKNYLKDIYVK